MRRRSKPSIVSGVTLPVTPMLDMTFQLLFFLVLTLRSDSAKEVKFKVDPPSSPGGVMPQGVDDAPSKLTVVVRALPDGSGGISGLTLQSFEGEWVVGDLPALRQLLKLQRGNSDQPPSLRIKADHRLKYSMVMEVIDSCGQAGFKKVGFAAPDS